MGTVSEDDQKLPFSQRNGYSAIPPQLKLEEVSDEHRKLIDYHITEEIGRFTSYVDCFESEWKHVAKELCVRFLGLSIGDFRDDPDKLTKLLRNIILRAEFFILFDLVEFLCQQHNCSDTLKRDLSGSFEESRSAYRMIDLRTIVAVGNEELAKTYLGALEKTAAHEADGARTHLINAGKLITDRKFSDSVRESITAVEAAAKKLDPKSSTLGAALKTLSKRYSWNDQLKIAIEKLYAYTNVEKGIRHALGSDGKANVDEADALFMLGACASLVTYLLLQDVQSR